MSSPSSCRVASAVCLAVQLGNVMVSAQGGWTDVTRFLVTSDGSRSLGNCYSSWNDERDQGSKIVYFDRVNGNNDSAGVYWWDGTQLVDSTGSSTNAAGQAYGTDPLQPNESAIKAFQYPVGTMRNATADPRLRTHDNRFAWVAAGYPDWFLLRRGQVHDVFDGSLDGGRSEDEPFVVAAYGPLSDGRAVVDPDESVQVEFDGGMRSTTNPFSGITRGDSAVWYHKALVGLELHQGVSNLGTHWCASYGDSVPSLLMEDCKFINGQMNYLPINTTMRRSVNAFRHHPTAHNQGYYTSDFKAATTFDEVIFYKNGHNSDPLVEPDPSRDIFSRNIYQGGGAQMGHTYRNIISADGGSGGPQMRLGGLCENSLIIEGYWYSATNSNSPVNDWLVASQQTGRSAVVRNNVQLIFKYPTPNDPDTDTISDSRSQPGWGYTLQGASFGAMIENNIVSHAMLTDDLGAGEAQSADAFKFSVGREQYQDSMFYTQRYDTIRNNIGYRTSAGLGLASDWTDVVGHLAEGNVFVADEAVNNRSDNLTDASQLQVRNNRFYANDSVLESGAWMGSGNTLGAYTDAATAEGWPDPDRTLKRYATEQLNLTLLDWTDEPYWDAGQVAVRSGAGEEYDPMGLRTFMAVATNMRHGGVDPVPASGKPSWTADYPWDVRFTGVAVVNWIREGFGLEPIIATRPASPGRARTTGVQMWARPHPAGGHGISFRAAPGSRVSLVVLDLFGRVVRELGAHRAGSGVTTIVWDGADGRGHTVARQACVIVCTVDGATRVAQRVLMVSR